MHMHVFERYKNIQKMLREIKSAIVKFMDILGFGFAFTHFNMIQLLKHEEVGPKKIKSPTDIQNFFFSFV